MKAVLAVILVGTLIGPVHAASLDRLDIEVTRAEDIRAIKKLQREYGYYADRGLWDALADLFTDNAYADYPSGIFDGNASIRAMFIQNLGQGKPGLAEGRIYNHTILQPVVDLAPDGATATGRWRVLGMLGRFGGSATWADSLYRFDYVKQNGRWKIQSLIAYAGSGGSYDAGWTPPKPRPPGYVDTSPVRFNLPHPADRPRNQPCEDDASVCVVPFPYPNRGGIVPPAQVSAVIAKPASAAELIQRAQRLADEQAVMNLQHAYGYYIDRGLWAEAANLFAPNGSMETGQAGVYVGRKRVRQALALSAPQGINDHLEFEPVVDVNGATAKARIFELAFVGARLVQNVHENEYVRRGSKWMIQSLHSYTILVTDYDQGWAKSALPAPTPSKTLPPDRPPTVTYEAYPKVFTPPFHTNDAPSSKHTSGTLANAERQVQRALDYDEIENLQNAYGYYAEKSLWSDIAALFTEDGVLEIDNTQYAGRERILAFLKSSGPEGPVKGVLNSLLQLQPVIHVAADGRTARIRSRVLQLTRDSQGNPMWGGGIYENVLMNDKGVWKFERLHLYRTYEVPYKGGWVNLPRTRSTPPFHY